MSGETRADREKAFWTEVLTCRACDEKGWVDVQDSAGNDCVRRCPNHDWDSHHAGRIQPRYIDLTERQPDERPDYPREWTSKQRLTAYWFALGRKIPVKDTNHWRRILKAAETETVHRRAKYAAIRADANRERADADIPPPPDPDEPNTPLAILRARAAADKTDNQESSF